MRKAVCTCFEKTAYSLDRHAHAHFLCIRIRLRAALKIRFISLFQLSVPTSAHLLDVVTLYIPMVLKRQRRLHVTLVTPFLVAL